MTTSDSPMLGELLSLEWLRLDALVEMEGNHKLHDIGAICASIRLHGFKDPMKWEHLLNGGEGGLVEGNGRLEALRAMYQGGDAVPVGLKVDDDGMWKVPIVTGVDALTESEARVYGFDHNILTLGDRVKKLPQILKMFDAAAEDELPALAAAGHHPQTISVSDLEAMRLLRQAQAEYDAINEEPEIAGVGELTRRVVLIFEAKEEADAAFARLGVARSEGQVLYRWEECRGS